MTKINRLLPFSFMPASWGLQGESRKIAESEYNFDGEDLEIALAKIKFGETSPEFERALVAIEYEYGLLTESQYDYKLLACSGKDELQTKIATVALDCKYQKISESEMEKQIATLEDRPYVNVLSMGVNQDNAVEGYFELDWNEKFVALISPNFKGTSDEDIVNQWFNAICNVMRMQQEADRDYGLIDDDDVTYNDIRTRMSRDNDNNE